MFEKHQDADAFLHLGDSEFQYNDTELSLYHRVKGNCDFYPEFPEEEIIEERGYESFLHTWTFYDVNRTRMKLAEKQNLYLANLHFMDILMLLNMRILLEYMLLIQVASHNHAVI